ncbi:hypothetical protein VRRI112168_07715 [Vreelandella rituensis]|uniref:Uncharacterized protein n=1 Tax=Vreelandella rituensis TaxID=2282306 RepID=A0A368TQC8_9GAMM|nr:hypothetical protein [Halomonas rituensis]RCV86516.1 hypothetical protein DU506_18270 [Halomonas rituensis]
MNDVTKFARVALDGNGGVALHGRCGNALAGRALVINEPGLRALDLIEADHLEVLDLRGCESPQPLHLMLLNVPKLREIRLPLSQSGAVIHLSAEETPRSLTLHGPVSEMDAAWPGGSFRIEAPKRPWKDVSLLGADADPTALSNARESGLTIALDNHALSAAVSLSGPTDWLVVNAHSLRDLTLTGSGRVQVQGASGLCCVNVLNGHTLHLEDTQALTTVSGVGRDLVVKGKLRELTVQGRWEQVQLHAPRLSAMTLAQGKRLTLYHCRRLTTVALPNGIEVDCHGSVPPSLLGQARFYVDEATVTQTLERLLEGEIELLPILLEVLSRRSAPLGTLHSLLALKQLAELGFDPDGIWACRRELSAHHLQGKQGSHRNHKAKLRALARADLNWRWNFPQDRVEEGWQADLVIWEICQGHNDTANGYIDSMLKGCEQEETLKRLIAYATRSQATPAVLTLMLQAMQWWISGPKGNSSETERLMEKESRLLRRLVATFKREHLQDTQRQQILAFITQTAPISALPTLLTSLMPHRPGMVRAQVMHMSRAPDEWFERRLRKFPLGVRRRHPRPKPPNPRIQALRSQFVQLALMPATAMPVKPGDTTRLLADIDEI